MNSSPPLVSIIVISYNASKTIIETLESIKLQTYSPLELIIAEDHSTDDTAKKCEEWLSKNSSRFVNSKLIVNVENQGVSANLNIGIQASTGEWIKTFSDDVLVSDAIEKNIAFASANNSNIVVSMVQPFIDETGEKLDTMPAKNYKFPTSYHDQYMAFLKNKIMMPSPTWFFRRDLYNQLGGYDIRFRLSDDIPFAHKIFESGNCFSYLPEITVLYRVKSNSLSNSKGLTGQQKQKYFNSRSAVYYELFAPALKKHRLWSTLILNNLLWFFYKKKIYSKDNSFARYFYGAFFTIIRMLC